jgi:hypothetical protein
MFMKQKTLSGISSKEDVKSNFTIITCGKGEIYEDTPLFAGGNILDIMSVCSPGSGIR